MYSDEDGSFTETTSVSHYANATKTASQVSPTANVSMNIDVDESAVEESESAYDDINTTQLPVASTAKPLSQGRWHSADEIYQLVVEAKEVVEDVPPGDKSNSYLLFNNERSMKRLSTDTTKKCDFFDDCGTWDHKKGNTVKTAYVVTDDSLRNVELKTTCTQRKCANKRKSYGCH